VDRQDADKSSAQNGDAQRKKMNRRKFLGVAGGATGLAAIGLWAGCNGTRSNSGEVVRIVSSLPRTGSAKGQTNTIVNGIQMAIDEFGGEVAGMQIDYLDWDDATAQAGQWAAEIEKANAQKAAADPDVMAFIGPYNSGAAMVSMPELNEAGLIQVSPACTWPGLTKKVEGVAADEPDKYRPAKRITFCRVCTTDDVQGPLSADFAKKAKADGGLGVKSVFILDDKELYGAGVAKLFARRCEEIGITILGHEGITVSSIEFGSLMTKIKGANPDLVYFGGTTQSKGGQIAKDLVAKGPNCPLMAPDGCYEQAFIDSAGPDVLNGRCYVSMVGVESSLLTGAGADFVKKYKEKYKSDPEAYAVYGYEAAKVVLVAIKEIGKKDREAIIKKVLATKDFDKGALGKWSFDANGDTTLRQLTISKVEDGKFKPITTEKA
jgi:branched-chain amino acid transport system substrate-binding protein